MNLGKIINHEVVVARVGEGRFDVGGMTLFNPTEQTYLDLGFEELPTANPQEGYHDEYRVATRKALKSVLIGVVYTSELQDGERVTVPHETYEMQEVDEEYIVAVAVEDAPVSLPPVPQMVYRYSKLRIVDALIEAGVWQQVKAMIQQDENNWDRFTQSQDFASDYPMFVQLVAAIRQAFPQLDADEILEGARI